jgi:hypothetical protein
MSVEEIMAVVRPPEKPDEVEDENSWAFIERELGITLPSDYREFIFRFGSGVLCYHFRVFNVFSKDQYIGLPGVHRVCENLRAFKKEEGDEYIPYAIFPERPGILPWGNDCNGNEYYWFTQGGPEEWTVVKSERGGPLWKEFGYTMTTFLAKALKREVGGLWSGKFPLPQHLIFEKYTDSAKEKHANEKTEKGPTNRSKRQ